MPYSRSSNFFISTKCITATKTLFTKISQTREQQITHIRRCEQGLKTPNAKNKKIKKPKKRRKEICTSLRRRIFIQQKQTHIEFSLVSVNHPIQSNIVILIRPSRIGLFQRPGTHINVIKFYPKSGLRRITTASSPPMMIATVNIFVISLVVVLKKKQELK